MRCAHWSDAYMRGLAGVLVAAVAGVWLIAAPFLFAYQPVGEDWVDATRVGVSAGAALVGLGLLAAALLVAGIRAEMATAGASGALDGPGYDDLDQTMVEVTAALLADLEDARAGGQGARPDDDPPEHGRKADRGRM